MRKKIKHNKGQKDASSILPPCNKKGQGDVTIFSCVVHKISLERLNKTQMTLIVLAERSWCPGNSGNSDVRGILTVYPFLHLILAKRPRSDCIPFTTF